MQDHGSWDSILPILRFVVIGLCSVIIYFSMNDLLKTRRQADPKHPSSFFSLDQITSGFMFRSISLFFAGSAAILYAALAFQGTDLMKAMKKALIPYVGKDTTGVGAVFDAIPDWLDPIVVLVVFLALFAAKVRAPLLLYRDVLVGGAGIYSIVDETSVDAAQTLIERNGSYERASRVLSDALREAPVPEELVEQHNAQRLAFQMIWLSLAHIRENGVAPAFAVLREKLGFPAAVERNGHVSVLHLLAASTIFLVLMGLYIIIVPAFGGFIPKGVLWPDPNAAGWSTVVQSVFKSTLAFAFPLFLAMSMYPLRRRAYWKKETEIASFAIVASAQWVLAFVMLEIFNVIDVMTAYQSGQDHYTFGLARLHIGAFLYAFCPIIAFTAWTRLKPKVNGTLAFGASIGLIVGASFGLCETVYECYWRFDYYFIHQALFGLCVTLAFFLAVSFTPKPDSDRDLAAPAAAPI